MATGTDSRPSFEARAIARHRTSKTGASALTDGRKRPDAARAPQDDGE